MALSVENYYSGSWVDVSDYIVSGTSEVPFISRNRDFTIRAESWNVVIAGTLRDVRGSTYNFTVGDKFRVYNGSNILFYGIVDESTYNYEEQVFEVIVKDALSTLQQIRLEYGTLHSAIAVTGASWYEYVASDEDGIPRVGVMFAVKKMFLEAGYTLDTTDVDSEVLVTYDFGTGIGSVDIEYQKLLMNENAIYCINQSVAAYYTTIDNNVNDYNDNKITFFDFISEVCSQLGLGIQLTSVDNYKLIRTAGSSNYTITDDNKFSYRDRDVRAKRTVNDIGATYVYNTASHYADVSAHANAIISNAGSGISLYPHFVIVFTDTDVNDPHSTVALALTDLNGDVSDDLIIEESAGVNNYNAIAYKVRAETTNYTEEEIVTSVQDTYKTVVENFIDLENQTSRIVQETY